MDPGRQVWLAGAMTHSRLGRLADWSYRRRRTVVVAWIAALFATIALSSAFAGDFAMTFGVPGAESEEARELLEERFPARAGDTVQVVFETPGTVGDPAVRDAVETTLARMAEVDHV